MADFGQSNFGQSIFGQFIFGQFIFVVLLCWSCPHLARIGVLSVLAMCVYFKTLGVFKIVCGVCVVSSRSSRVR